jgi:hypothetical protein
VIARGSAFALRHLAADPQAAGKALRVAYVVSGTASIDGARVWLRVEIIDVAGGGIVWTGDFSESRAAFTELIAGLTDRVVHSVHMQVTAAESRRARAKPRETLDAWESYHAGVPDAFRSEPDRIERALERFRVAARLSPGFARAYAGQSACHYVRVFTGMTGDRAAEIALARRAAEEALDADETDPLSPWTYGRILWLEGDPEGCLSYVRRAVGLSPSFALGHYEIGAVEATKGDAARAVTHLDLAMELSPFDPVMPAALIARSMALFRLGRLDAAAQAARDAVRQPNTFATILAPAALILASVGHVEEARRIAARLETTPGHPGLEALRAALFRMSDHIGALLTKNGRLIGL